MRRELTHGGTMKVLLTSMNNPYLDGTGGKHIHLQLLEKGLVQSDVDVKTAYPALNRENLLAKSSRYAVQALLHGDLRPFLPIQLFRLKILGAKVKQELQKYAIDDFDIVHAHDTLSLSAYHEVFPRADCPAVLTLHGYFPNEVLDASRSLTGSLESRLHMYCAGIERAGIEAADAVIAVDTRIKEYLRAQFAFPEDRIVVMPNATDTDLFHPVTLEEKKALRRRQGFGADPFIVIVPRRLVPKNGVEFAIRSMEHIKHGDIRLLILGDGVSMPQLKALARGDSRVQFLGEVPHDRIADYYKLSDAVLIPSITSNDIQEATSLSMLEGMACGKAVICSDIGGMKEVIQHGRTGFLVPERAPKEIAEAIVDILEENIDLERVTASARDYVERHHSYVAHAREVKDIYERIEVK